MGRWQSDRWIRAGENSAGDPVYERNTQAAASKKAPAKKKPAAKKKA